MLIMRIRELREDRDLTQKELAAALGLPVNTYGNYETNRRDIPIEVLIELAKYYGTSVDYLLGLTDAAKPLPPSRRKNI